MLSQAVIAPSRGDALVIVDAYSGFEGTGLAGLLRAAAVHRLFVGGLATDYCVLNTVRDALRNGFAVALLVDAVRAVDVRPGDGQRAIAEMRRLGAVATGAADIEAAASPSP